MYCYFACIDIKMLYPLSRGPVDLKRSYWPVQKRNCMAQILKTKYAATEMPVTLQDIMQIL